MLTDFTFLVVSFKVCNSSYLKFLAILPCDSSLIAIHISEWCSFSAFIFHKATCLKRGGIFKHEFVANLLQSRLVKKFWKSDNNYWSYGQEFGVIFFWLTVYIYSSDPLGHDTGPDQLYVGLYSQHRLFPTAPMTRSVKANVWQICEQIIPDYNSETMDKKLWQKQFSLIFDVLSLTSNVARLTRQWLWWRCFDRFTQSNSARMHEITEYATQLS